MRADYVGVCLTAGILLAGVTAWAKPLEELEPVPEQDIRRMAAAMPSAPSVQPKQSRKLLVVWLCRPGSPGYYHESIPWGNKALEMMGKRTGAYEAVLTRDASVFRPEYLQQFDAVFLNNSYRLQDEMGASHRQALVDFVAGGKGLAALHAAGGPFGNWKEGSDMLGCTPEGHPWFADDTVRITIEDPDHPINRGFQGQDFLVKEEIWQFGGNYSRDNLRILLALDMYDPVTATGSRMPPRRVDRDYAVSWIRKHGQGRVFYCSLGHNKDIYWNPAILQHYLDGIQFVLGDLTDADVTPSAQVYDAADIQRALPKLLAATCHAEVRSAEREIGLLLSRTSADMDRAVGPLVEAASESTGAKREALLRLCGRSNHTAALRHLRRLLDSDQQQLRLATIVALGQCAVSEGTDLLVHAMKQANSDAEHHLALTTLVAIPTLPRSANLPELLDKALGCARSEQDVKTIFSVYAKAQNRIALKKVVTYLDQSKYRDVAIDVVLDLSTVWTNKKHAPDDIVAACEKVITVAPNEEIKTIARERIRTALEVKERFQK